MKNILMILTLTLFTVPIATAADNVCDTFTLVNVFMQSGKNCANIIDVSAKKDAQKILYNNEHCKTYSRSRDPVVLALTTVKRIHYDMCFENGKADAKILFDKLRVQLDRMDIIITKYKK